MKILLTGGNGMLGRTLQRTLGHHQLAIADLPEVDITRLASIAAAIAAFHPTAVIHAAAMTAVDACETDADRAFAVNACGSANVAIACHRHRARLLAISTDYVFDGALERPYHEWDPPNPQTVYGASKWAGEEAIRTHCPDHAIIRTAWLYGPGGPSFYHAMLKLGAQDGAPLKVVDDQIGNPTSTEALATLLARLLDLPLAGTFHASCEGETTWHGFAQEIFRLKGLSRGLVPCTTADFPRPAPRPANSRLDKRALRLHNLPPMPHWRDALAKFVTRHPEG
ncbi:MAG: dTDP-4-dehydrorhamnose reductase [Lentisphaeria bacterium]|jgi:dTDP-4-dehydrorhamnose reductase